MHVTNANMHGDPHPNTRKKLYMEWQVGRNAEEYIVLDVPETSAGRRTQMFMIHTLVSSFAGPGLVTGAFAAPGGVEA